DDDVVEQVGADRATAFARLAHEAGARPLEDGDGEALDRLGAPRHHLGPAGADRARDLLHGLGIVLATRHASPAIVSQSAAEAPSAEAPPARHRPRASSRPGAGARRWDRPSMRTVLRRLPRASAGSPRSPASGPRGPRRRTATGSASSPRGAS